jgi:hypothetical protein
MKTNRALSAARASEDRQKCRDWLIPHMSGDKPKALTKDQYRELARREFSFSAAAFNDAWIWAIEDTGRHDWYEGKGREETTLN